MKQALILSVSAAAALTLAACQRTDSQPTADAGTTNEAINAAQDATSAAVGATAAATVGPMTTESFATNAAIGDAYEIQAGQIAQSKGQSAAVRDFGKMMVSEHTAMSNTLAPLSRAAGVTLPSGLDERRKGLIDNLNAAAPADFDQVYLNQQVAAHEEALTLMQNYAERGDDPALKAAAAKAAPKVESHLERVRALQAGRPGAN
jgi:putative membrane protein